MSKVEPINECCLNTLDSIPVKEEKEQGINPGRYELHKLHVTKMQLCTKPGGFSVTSTHP
jgi:hypothetical protein